ncbi:MAG: 3-phosphoglycerate dehydrogenase [Clostridiales bacterium]|jgi:D-3-phosphoglycerate dehydrogenase|nr:3-phosphoglycerate dehydrogenase [Clostridiales bacterium]
MYTIKTLNNIAQVGLDRFDKSLFRIDNEASNPDAILVRSTKMLDYEFNESLLCIARAGAGYNNIPCDRCAEAGIVVFNTPGANASGVKELVLCSLFLSSRDILSGSQWVKSIAHKGDEVTALVESGKKAFAGPEIYGKTLGLVGLGAIGAKVARDATALGMKVYGVDPYLPPDVRAELSGTVKILNDEKELYAISDYISLHVPYNEETRHKICASSIAHMKDGVRIINTARGELVSDDDIIAAIASGKVACYVTDFPNAKTANHKGIIAIPHLGASTPESEDNCAVMAADQVSEYLLNGNIINSVNLPNITLHRHSGNPRVVIIMKDYVGAHNAILTAVASTGASVISSTSKTRGNYYAVLLDLDKVTPDLNSSLNACKGVIRVRIIL